MEFYKTETIGSTKQVVNHAFPPIIITGVFAVGEDVLEAGTPVALDADDKYVPLDLEAEDTAKDVVGVAVKDVDTTVLEGAVGPILRLGLVHLDALTDSSPEVIKALAAQKIFAS